MTTAKTKVTSLLAGMATGLAIILAILLMSGWAADASTFFAWKVTDVEKGDLLFVRDRPDSRAAPQAGYPNGTVLSLTGRCTKGHDLEATAGRPVAAQRQAVRTSWCQIWHDPARDAVFRDGWAYGRYLTPIVH